MQLIFDDTYESRDVRFYGEVSPTLRSGREFKIIETMYFQQINDTEIMEKQYRIRKLTEREVFRLLDVDEKDIDTLLSSYQETDKQGKTIEKKHLSSSACYKLAGNSIVVSPMYLIFKNVFFPEAEKPKAGEQLSLF